MKKISIFAFLVFLLCLYATRQQSTYGCSVPNCQVCTYLNFCGLCNPGYIMEISASTGQPYCNPVSCNVTFCTTCFANNTCETCNTNYQPTVNGQCQPIPSQQPTCIAKCLVCSDSLTCLSCSYGYVLLRNGSCAPAYPLPYNCLVAMSSYPSICQICKPNTALSPTYSCQPFTANQICTPNCIYCNLNNICSQCQPQYFLTSSNQCLPNTIPNCQQYTDPNYTTCQSCSYGFTLVNGSCVEVAFGCQIDNCVICYQENLCYICEENYVPFQNGAWRVCVPAQFINSMYSPSLMVPGCRVFYPLNFIPSSVELPYSSNYNPLCIECQPGFALIGGMCTLTSPYLCNVANCKNCSFNNYCGICEVGYGAREGLCYKLYSPLPGCLITSKYQVSCQTCQQGYVNLNYFCYPNNNSITCKVYGCQYCTTNNTCIQCQPIFNPVYINSSLTCQSNCTVPGCFQCYGNGACYACSSGYFLNSTTLLCEDQVTACPVYVGVGCVECTLFGQCLKCDISYSLYNGRCCLTSYLPPTIIGCLLANPCQSSQCLQCYPGYYLSNEGLCLSLPCDIPNCLYCFETSSCIVCNPQYRLDPVQRKCVFNGQYLGCRTSQDPYCINCFGIICTSCDTGTTLVGGQCYCDIPGCITCMGSLFCIQCAYPLQTDPISGGCVPLPQKNTICQVQNCALCNKPNVCSVCSPGYSLNQQNQCVINNCTTMPNCGLCDARQTVCYSCNSPYALGGYSAGTCVYLPYGYQCNSANCALCQTQNSSLCQICFQTYYLQQGLCLKVPCSTGCQYCFASNSCIACNLDYQLNPYGGCSPRSNSIACGIQYCIKCSSMGACETCLLGYQPNANGVCMPQTCLAMNCRICLPTASGVCLICQQGYYLNSYQQCMPYSPIPQISSCNIPKCLQCYGDNACAVCLPSFQLQSNQCVYNSSHCLSSLCTNCTQNYYCYNCIKGYYALGGSCVFNQSNCSDLNCLTCFSYMDCEACKSGYMREVSGGNGVCKKNNLSLILGITIPIGLIILASIGFLMYKLLKKKEDASENQKPEEVHLQELSGEGDTTGRRVTGQ